MFHDLQMMFIYFIKHWSDRLAGFLGQGHDLPQPFRLPMVLDVQVDAHKEDSMT